jgi:NAD(P)-dependent dehydrogenase (short-subunit alcohol dehydrogenase family)
VIDLARPVDAALELTVVPSFTNIGFAARRNLFHWTDLDAYDLTGRTVAITGGTSGLGRAAAQQLAREGATVIVLGRDHTKSERVVGEIRDATANERVSAVVVDMGDLTSVRDAAARIRAEHDRLDVLVHNAGALTNERHESPDGIEMTVASQVVGPFLLTSLLLDRLAAAPFGRVITMSSGGMYTADLTVSSLQMDPGSYNGTQQYARAKRAQVTLNELWAQRFPDRRIVFHSMHPGWADTPGVEASLPAFHRFVGPLLRSPAAGADTLVWLASDDGEPLATTGGFWLDRRVRSIHRLRHTARSDTPARRRALWDWVVATAGQAPAPVERDPR